jgi:hypothetical protein
MAIRIVNALDPAKPRAVNRSAAVNTVAVNKRGAYPATDARRAYMAEVMRRRRVELKADAARLAQID